MQLSLQSQLCHSLYEAEEAEAVDEAWQLFWREGRKYAPKSAKMSRVSRRPLRPSTVARPCFSNMAASSMTNLFELQDKEKLLEFNLYVSGGTRFKGSESSALSLLNKFRLEGEAGFCDVILEIEGRQLTTHRCVLAANSQFFYTMFSSGMKESNQKVLNLQSVSFTAMSLILDYFYTREIVINDENVLDLLNASSFLLVTPVKNACIQLLYKRLSIENCFSVLQVAEQFGADNLAKRANDFIKTNFSIVVNSEEFVCISQKDLVHFIASDDIQVEKEKEVYQAVMKWVKHDEESRIVVLPELLEHLRKGSLPKRFLESERTKEPLLMVAKSQTKPVKKKNKRAVRWGKSRKARAASVKSEPQKLRPSTELHNVMIGIGTDNCRKAFCYDLDKKETLILSDLSLLQYHPQVAIVGRTLYLVGGQKYNNDACKRVSALCFDDAKNLRSSMGLRMQLEWKTKMPFKDVRFKATLVELDGLLYYIGGWDVLNGSRNTVERYNPEIDEWDYCASLNTSRCKSSCVTAKGHIYVIGGGTTLGDFGGSALSSVEKYDPELDSWSFVASMKEARSYPGCVYWHDKIYAVGGIDTNGFQTTSCEVYSPIKDEWNAISPLPYPYCGVNNVIIVKNQVTVPLTHETTDFSCDALKYSLRSNVWQKVKSLGPSDKIVSFTLCTTQLPVLILQRMERELFPVDFFGEWKDSDEEGDFFGSSSDSGSFFGWNSPVNDSDDFDLESSDGDGYF